AGWNGECQKETRGFRGGPCSGPRLIVVSHEPQGGLRSVHDDIRANAIHDRLLADRSLTLEEIAKEEKMVASYATRLFRLTLLVPNIVGAILNGNQPPELTARKLMDDTRLPLDWNEQRRALGFA
ncbi:MAG: hypothetical protein WBE50_06740, partial [Methyloceanibacter sp.]